jgi:sec-independent protein translocase protein TatA
METIGLPELLVIGLVLYSCSERRRFPEMGKGLGEGIRSFKAAIKGVSPEKPAAAVQEEQTVTKA